MERLDNTLKMGRLCLVFPPLVLSGEAPDDNRTVNLEKMTLTVFVSWSVMWPRNMSNEYTEFAFKVVGTCGS